VHSLACRTCAKNALVQMQIAMVAGPLHPNVSSFCLCSELACPLRNNRERVHTEHKPLTRKKCKLMEKSVFGFDS
jgi:hypothetical protein